jgi:hypothetical protein
MASERSPLRFKGAPTRLIATLPAPQGVPKTGRLVLPDKEPVPLTIRRMHSTTPSFAVLSVRLPKSTRPGSYAGSAEVGGVLIPVEIEVEARPRLRFLPPKVSFRGAPGARPRTKLTVLNLGNVDVTIEPESTFCIFDNRGVDQAFFQALTEKVEDGKRRIDRVFDELAESHGGLVRAVVQEGAGELAPEEARELTVEFQFSRRMRAGQTYRGGWSISEASLEVEIEATKTVKFEEDAK